MAFAERGRLVYQDEDGLLDLPLPRLPGAHQVDNAGLAVADAQARRHPRSRSRRIEAGLANADWPARMQRLKSGPLVDAAPPGSDIWLDGGHNPAAGNRHRAGLRGDRGPRSAPADPDLPACYDQGPGRLLPPLRGARPPRDDGAGAGSEAGFDPETLAAIAMECGCSGARLRRRRAPRSHPCATSCGRGAAAAHPDLRLALSRRSVLKENGPLPE